MISRQGLSLASSLRDFPAKYVVKEALTLCHIKQSGPSWLIQAHVVCCWYDQFDNSDDCHSHVIDMYLEHNYMWQFRWTYTLGGGHFEFSTWIIINLAQIFEPIGENLPLDFFVSGLLGLLLSVDSFGIDTLHNWVCGIPYIAEYVG